MKMDNSKKITYFKEYCRAYKQDPADETVATKFYTLLGQVKLYVVLEYGICQLKKDAHGPYLPVYTTEPRIDPEGSGLAVVQLGIKRLIQEVLTLKAQSLVIDPAKIGLALPRTTLEQLEKLLYQAQNFKLKKMPAEKTLMLENNLRKVIKQDERVKAAWLLGILLADASEYKYVAILEYTDENIAEDEKFTLAERLAKTVTNLVDEEVLFGSTTETVGAKVKQEFVPFYIKR